MKGIRYVTYIISVLLSVWLIMPSLAILMQGILSWHADLQSFVISLDFIAEGLFLIAYSICFICNWKWISQKKFISLLIIILLAINLISLGYLNHYLKGYIIMLLFLLIVYILNVYVINAKQKSLEQ